MRKTTSRNQEPSTTDPVAALFPEVQASWQALFDVKETRKEITILVDLPGVDEDRISIKRVDGSLVIKADREFDHELEDTEEYRRIERPYGQLGCTVSVPDTADTDGMTAKYKRGVLKVHIPLKNA